MAPKTCCSETSATSSSAPLERSYDGRGCVVVIATGGTIACTRTEAGALEPSLSAADLIEMSGTSARCRGVDVTAVDSSSISLRDIDALVARVHHELEDPATNGVVVTHGTDSLADTALALDIFHADPRPVVVTGAQRSADAPDSDGPSNLRAAIDYVNDGLDLGKGCVVSFDGEILPARGLLKRHTSELAAFASSWSPATVPGIRPDPSARTSLAGMRIPVVAAWPGAPGDIVDAVAATQPDGIIVQALGAGNVSDGMGGALIAALEAGIPVVVTTGVPYGAVEFAYGGAGGGSTLGSRGAIPGGWLRAGQARIALAAALASGLDPEALIGAWSS